MPLRHILFNKRNGAPQRAPDAQPISLDSASYFSLDTEFPSYQWPDDDYAEYSPSVTHGSHLAKDQASSNPQIFDQSHQHPYNSVPASSYHGSLNNLESKLMTFSGRMDTDTSSISRSSIQSSVSSTSHINIMWDTDGSSLDSLSRKHSLTSSFTPDAASPGLCPLLSGQVGQCHPNTCGPDSPCLQYVNTNYVTPHGRYIPRSHVESHPIPRLSNNLIYPVSYEEPIHSQSRQRGGTVSIKNPTASSSDAQQSISTEVAKADPDDDIEDPIADVPSATAKKGQASQNTNKRSKARQAHSLVERKYRENLNAKIQELHLTLKRARFGRSRQNPSINSQLPHRYDEDEAAVEDITDTEKSYKVKKSDVLIEAMDYVHATERELHRMQEEINQLKSHVRAMEGWMRPENQRMPAHNMHHMHGR